MKTNIQKLVIALGLMVISFLAGQLIHLKKPDVQPAGGQTCNKCFHAGGFSNNTPACGNGVAVTSGNFHSLCVVGCLGTYFNCP